MIYRSEHKKNYTVISNECIRDRRLSLKARGLLMLMLSQRDDYNFSIAALTSMCRESVCALRSAAEELKKAGYLRVRKTHPNDTYEYVYTIRETPLETGSESRAEITFCPDANTSENHTAERSSAASSSERALNQNAPRQNTANQIVNRQGAEYQGAENRTHINNKYKNNNNINTLNINNNNNQTGSDGTEKDEILKKTFAEYMQMRKEMNRPFTKKSAELALKGLYEMSTDTDTQIKIIEQSIKNGWLGLYELKDERGRADCDITFTPTSDPDEIERCFEESYSV